MAFLANVFHDIVQPLKIDAPVALETAYGFFLRIVPKLSIRYQPFISVGPTK
jgi:hypothetical protein